MIPRLVVEAVVASPASSPPFSESLFSKRSSRPSTSTAAAPSVGSNDLGLRISSANVMARLLVGVLVRCRGSYRVNDLELMSLVGKALSEGSAGARLAVVPGTSLGQTRFETFPQLGAELLATSIRGADR